MFTRRKIIQTGLASAAIIQMPGITQIAQARTDSGAPSVTFNVDDVELGTKILPLQPARQAIERLASVPLGTLESWTQDTPQLIESQGLLHPFIEAMNTAYHNHLPIVLSPDMIWLCVLQGLASHVTANAEALRHHFVAHEGKLLIEIRRDQFTKGNPKNDWEGAFAEFSQGIRGHIGNDTHDLIASGFGTTGPVEQAAMNVSLMDAMQSYFVYGATTACGFPSVTLEGSQDDWQAVHDRAAKLATYDLSWWTPHLLPVLDQFVETAAGRPSKDFWCNFYKFVSGSGTANIQGHILNLFPYFGRSRPTKERLVSDFEIFIRNTVHSGPRSEADIVADIRRYEERLEEDNQIMMDTLRRNPYLGRTDLKWSEGMTTEDVATKLNSAPMVWNYLGQMLQMELLAGFVGATQDPVTRAVRPKIGWAVRDGTG